MTLTKESIFHRLKESKTNIYYDKLWAEICDHLQWPALNNTRAVLVNLKKDAIDPAVELEQDKGDLPRTANN
jgi:hypothetical protein